MSNDSSPSPSPLRPFLVLVVIVLLAVAGHTLWQRWNTLEEIVRKSTQELARVKGELATLQEKLGATLSEQGQKLSQSEETIAELQAAEDERKKAVALNAVLTEFAPSVVKLSCTASAAADEIRRGSGALYRSPFGESGFVILTSLHVVETIDDTPSQCTFSLYPDPANAEKFLVYKSEGHRFFEKSIDIAFLTPQTVKDNPSAGPFERLATFARSLSKQTVCSAVQIGEHLSILGYPAVGGETLTITDGIVSGFELVDGVRYFKTSAKIERGVSGGMAIRDSGCLLGVPTFVRRGQLESIGRILDLTTLSQIADLGL